MKKLIAGFLFLLSFYFRSNGQEYIVGYEYWCDTSYNSRIYVSTPPQSSVFLDTAIGFPGISKGLHTMHLRFQQTNFFWSQTISQYFYMTGEGPSDEGKIKSYRYWVQSSDSVVTFHLSNPVSPYYLSMSLDLAWIPRGSNYLYMQYCDEQDNWSVPTIDSIYRTSVPVAEFNSPDTFQCDLDTIHFYNTSRDADAFLWHFGDGDSSTAENPVHVYQQPGVYSVTLTVTDTTLGIDSTIILTDYIRIYPPAQASFSWTQAGLNITFINNSTNGISYKWIFGDGDISYLPNTVHTYPSAGSYTAILIAYDTCGSSADTQLVDIILGTNNLFNENEIRIIQSAELINIHFNSSLKECVYSLQNSTGQIIRSKQLPVIFPGYTESILTSDLAAGMYLLNITDAVSTLRKKLFIAH